MPPSNTSWRKFQDTRWSLVLQLKSGTDEKGVRKALEELCTLYWDPLYSYARRWLPPEDAEDATQSFFVNILKKNLFAEADSSKSKMRSYLLACFRHHLINDHSRETTLRRGKGFNFVSIDSTEAEKIHQMYDLKQSLPEAEYDKRWALAMLQNVFKKLESEYLKNGRTHLFNELLPFISLTGEQEMPAAEIAARLKTTPNAVCQAGRRLRIRFRDEVGDMIRHTLANPTVEAVTDELNALKQALRGK